MTDKKITKLHDILITGTKKMDSPNNINKLNDNFSDNDHEANDIPKNGSLEGRTPKNIKYASERKIILSELLEILEIDKKNNMFFIDALENDVVKKNKLMAIVGRVRMYFSCSYWVFFSKKNVPNPCTSLVKSILKDMGVKINSVSIRDNATNRIDKKGFKITLD